MNKIEKKFTRNIWMIPDVSEELTRWSLKLCLQTSQSWVAFNTYFAFFLQQSSANFLSNPLCSSCYYCHTTLDLHIVSLLSTNIQHPFQNVVNLFARLFTVRPRHIGRGQTGTDSLGNFILIVSWNFQKKIEALWWPQVSVEVPFNFYWMSESPDSLKHKKFYVPERSS